MPRVRPVFLVALPAFLLYLYFSGGSPKAPPAPPSHGDEPTPHDPRTFTRTIVAVGDLHGDLPNMQKVLRMARVVDAHDDWSGDVDVFVQTGDMIDRGDDAIAMYDWMDQLRAQAQAVGGHVMSHMGNHEWMNVIGDWRYVPSTEIKTFGTAADRQKMLATGRIGRTWAGNYTSASRLPLHPLLGGPNTDYPPPASKAVPKALSHAAFSFCHGGLAPTYPNLSPFPSKINTIGASLLHKLQYQKPLPPPHPPNPYPGLPKSATDEERRLYGSDGPLWYRGWALDDEEQACAAVDSVLDKTGTRRMIMGHTPDFERIVSRCGGKIIIIDTGISHAYGGALSALSVTYTLTPLNNPKTAKETKWKETEKVVALYLDHTEVLVDGERTITGDFTI